MPATGRLYHFLHRMLRTAFPIAGTTLPGEVVGDGDLGSGVVGKVALPHPFYFKVQEEASSNSVSTMSAGARQSPRNSCSAPAELVRTGSFA
jgi:hypothetical protein